MLNKSKFIYFYLLSREKKKKKDVLVYQTHISYHNEEINYAGRTCVFLEAVEYVHKLANLTLLI